MSVVAFQCKRSADLWSEAEYDTLAPALNAAIALGNGRGWAADMTENGDAQLGL